MKQKTQNSDGETLNNSPKVKKVKLSLTYKEIDDLMTALISRNCSLYKGQKENPESKWRLKVIKENDLLWSKLFDLREQAEKGSK